MARTQRYHSNQLKDGQCTAESVFQNTDHPVNSYSRLMTRAQCGHLLPFFRWYIWDCHSCSLFLEHIHQTFFLLFGVISNGVNFPFLVGCHSFTKSGYFTARLCFEEGWGNVSQYLTVWSHDVISLFMRYVFKMEALETTSSIRSTLYLGFPFMIFFAQPPNHFITRWSKFRGS